MTTGHYAPAYALKRRYPEAPLWQLFFAVQALDILFFVLVPLGIERVRLDQTQHMPLAMDLQFLPYSHSLVAALVYGAIAWSVGRAVGRPRVGVAIGLGIVSHWVCDVLVHVPDMPVFTGDGRKLGLSIWRWPLVSFAFEVGLLALAYGLLRSQLSAAGRRAGDVSFGVLCLVQVLSDFVLPTPPSTARLTFSAQTLFFTSAWLASRVDRAG